MSFWTQSCLPWCLTGVWLQLSAALERVRAGADIMPQRQLHQQLREQLGDTWRDKLQSFEDEPLAAASIGQACLLLCKLFDFECYWFKFFLRWFFFWASKPGSGPAVIAPNHEVWFGRTFWTQQSARLLFGTLNARKRFDAACVARGRPRCGDAL